MVYVVKSVVRNAVLTTCQLVLVSGELSDNKRGVKRQEVKASPYFGVY